MIGIPMRDWDGRSGILPRSISGSLVNEAICVGIISRTTSNSNHYFGTAKRVAPESIGEPLDSHPKPIFLGCSRLRRETMSGGEGFRVSDEAVVSDDPAGQHHPLASQGPLDGRVGVAGSRATLNRKALGGCPIIAFVPLTRVEIGEVYGRKTLAIPPILSIQMLFLDSLLERVIPSGITHSWERELR